MGRQAFAMAKPAIASKVHQPLREFPRESFVSEAKGGITTDS
jgi:hypothetical protein